MASVVVVVVVVVNMDDLSPAEVETNVHPDWSAFLRQRAEDLEAGFENKYEEEAEEKEKEEIDDDETLDQVQAEPLFDLLEEQPGPIGQKKRLGRPKKVLQELFAELPQQHVVMGDVRGHEPVETVSSSSSMMQGSTAVSALIPPECYSQDHFTTVSHNFFAKQPLLMPALLECVRQATFTKDTLDAGTQRLCDRFLNIKDFHLASGKVLQGLLNLDQGGLVKRLERLATTICLVQRSDRETLEKLVVTNVPAQMCVLYLDAESYDETPMLTSVKHHRYLSRSVPGLTDLDCDPMGLADVSKCLGDLKVATKAKLLQSSSCFSMLIQLVERPCLIMGETLNIISPLLRNQAQTLQQSLLRTSAVTEYSNKFSLKCRSVVVDQAASNLSCEESMVEGRGKDWSSMVLPCAVHQISSCIKKTCEGLMSHEVSSLVKAALSIVEGGKMAYFRQALTDEILSRQVQIIEGPLPADAALHQANLKELLLKKGAKATSKTLMLQATVNGDWRVSGCLQHVVPRGEQRPDPASLKELFATILVSALAGTQPIIFPRHRWTGSDESVAFFLLLHSVHNLLLPTYARFVSFLGKRSVAVDLAGAQAGALPITDQAEHGLDNHQVVLQVDLGQEPAHVQEQPYQSQQDPSTQQAALHAQHRRDTLSWLQSKPLASLLSMQFVLAPLNVLLRKQLKSSGVEHMMVERARIARLMLSGRWEDQPPTSQLALAASAKFEREFHEQVGHMLLNTSLWEVFPDEYRTVTQRALLHRLLARASAAVYELLGRAHSQFPVKLFALLECPAMATEMNQIPMCLKDPWSQKIQQCYGTLAHPMVKNLVVSQSLLQKCDISTIESRHAALRRNLLSRSLQTWRFGVSQCSAEWIMQNSRRLLSQRQGFVKKKLKRTEVILTPQHQKFSQPHRIQSCDSCPQYF